MRAPVRLRSAIRGPGALAVALACLPVAVGDLMAQGDPRTRLADYLLIYYVDRPNDERPEYLPELLDAGAVLGGVEEGVFWSDTDVPVLHDLVRSLLETPPDEETARFQHHVASILDVMGRRVAVYLVDDVGQVLTGDGKNARSRYGVSLDRTKRRVWPSARARSGSAGLAGQFATGAHHSKSLAEARSTFIHELTHVQTRKDLRPHLFSVAERGWTFRYGFDGTHYLNEVLPDLSSAYSEGVAGAAQLLFEPQLSRAAFEKSGPDDGLLIEAARPSEEKYGDGRDPDLWLYDRILEAGIPHELWAGDADCKDGDSCYVSVRIGDLPARFLVHNERMLAVVIAESVRRHLGMAGFARALRRANSALERDVEAWETAPSSRVTIQGIATLLSELGRESLDGESLQAASRGANEPIPHLLPLAYLDYMTGRTASTKADFAELFQGQLAAEWLDAYWALGRPRLETVLPPAGGLRTRAYEDLARIADAFGVAATPAS